MLESLSHIDRVFRKESSLNILRRLLLIQSIQPVVVDHSYRGMISSHCRIVRNESSLQIYKEHEV